MSATLHEGGVAARTAAMDTSASAVKDLIVFGDITDQVPQQMAAVSVDSANGTVILSGVLKIDKAAVAIEQGDHVFGAAGATVAATNIATNSLYFIGRAIKAAASGDAYVYVELLPFCMEGPREITLAATGAQTLNARNFWNGKGLLALVPNTAGLTLTFCDMDDCPRGMFFGIHKSAADAAAITIAADAGDTLVGSTGTVDALDDRVTFQVKAGGPVVIAKTIA